MTAVRALIVAASLGAGAPACVDQANDGGAWRPATDASGELAPDLGPRPLTATSPGCRIRIASWNVHYGEDVATLAARLREDAALARADVILLQEVEAYPDEDGSRTARLARALGLTWMYIPARVEGVGTHGIAVLSHLPLEAPAVRQLPYFEQPVRPRQRVASRVEVEISGRRLAIVNVHLDVRLGPVDRIRQLHPAIDDLGDRVVLGGDFNTNPWAWFDGLVPLLGTEAIVGQEQAAVLDHYLEAQGFVGGIPLDESTMQLPGGGMRVDNLYARGVDLIAAGVEHVEGSDHWPLWIDVDVCD